MAFPDNCNPRMIQVDESCGCTLTRASIKAMTKDDFEAQAFKEVGMDRIIGQMKEARMTGVPENSLMDLLMSRIAPVKKVNLGQQQSIIAPFFYVPQRNRINANYFVIESGNVHPTAGVGAVPASAWQIIVKNHAGTYATALVQLENYFLLQKFITVLNADTGTGVGRTLQFKVIGAVNADGGGVSKAKLSIVPNYSDAGWAALSGGDKAVYEPTHGSVIPMANSVSNYESLCQNQPSENTLKLLDFWLQTSRDTFCYNDEFLRALQAPLTSDFFKKFRQNDLVRIRKDQEVKNQRDWINTIFWGQRINELQTVNTYDQLPQVVDPENANCVLEYKANTIGLRTQLNDCGKVLDLSGGVLDMDLIKDRLNQLKRIRGADGTNITSIDFLTDRYTKGNIFTRMIGFYKSKYGLDTERFYRVGEAIKHDTFVTDFMVDKYQFPDEGIDMNIITHPYFDDFLSMFPTADKTRGRVLMGIDWSDTQIGLAETLSVSRQTNVLDNLYNCIPKPNVKHYQLVAKTYAAQLFDPNRHLIIENFSDACPTITVAGCIPS